ncbi:MAG: flagellar biosynthesis protein FlhF [Betaproteobacteria bacterium]
MRVKRYVAANSREALARARAEIGPDAVILSSGQTDAGFELLALAKADVAVLVGSGRSQAGREAGPPPVPQMAQPAPQRRTPEPKRWVPPASASAPAPVAAEAPAPPALAKPADASLAGEIRALRAMVEEQGMTLAWRQGEALRPRRSALLRELMRAGFSAGLSRRIADAVPESLTDGQASSWASAAIARNLRCGEACGEGADPAAAGGTFALVGPTGAGKTTTAAKLAAACVVRHGADSLGLISADHYRIGAQDQLRIYGRILGVAVNAVHDAGSLRSALQALAGKRLILIDSIGVGQRDPRVAEQTALFEEQGVARLLLLSATSQAETLEEVVQAYGAAPLAGSILTKTDEAAALGGVLDCAIRNRLRVSHVTNGQRVPEDIHPANAAYLVHRALSATGAPALRMRDQEIDLLAFSPPRAAVPAPMPAHAGT